MQHLSRTTYTDFDKHLEYLAESGQEADVFFYSRRSDDRKFREAVVAAFKRETPRRKKAMRIARRIQRVLKSFMTRDFQISIFLFPPELFSSVQTEYVRGFKSTTEA